jgi:hypothetical protein
MRPLAKVTVGNGLVSSGLLKLALLTVITFNGYSWLRSELGSPDV